MDASAIRSRFVAKAVVAGDSNEETPLPQAPDSAADTASNNAAAGAGQKYDPRTLYERLEEQRAKKEDEFREKTKLSNLIKKLDTDEIEFLLDTEVAKRKRIDAEREDVRQSLAEFRRLRASAERSADPAAAATTATADTTAATDPALEDLRRVVAVKSTAEILAAASSAPAAPAASSRSKPTLPGVIVRPRAAAKRALSADDAAAEARPAALAAGGTSVAEVAAVTGASEASIPGAGAKKLRPDPAPAAKVPLAAPQAQQPPGLTLLSGYGSDSEESDG